MSLDSTAGAKADILIIDDTPDNLRLLNQMLNTSYKVRLAPTGETGLTAARAAPPDLILLDVMMGDLDGYQVAIRLKADPLTADIPIIFISALDDTDSKVRGFAVGGVDYVTKPFQEKEVLARIETHVTLRRLHRQLQAELTTRQQVEAALRASENKYRTVADFTYDWEFWIGPDGQYVYISPACERLTGYTPQEVQAEPLLMIELVHPDDRALVEEHLKLEDAVGGPGQLVFRLISRDGTERWIEHVCQPVRDQAGRWLGRRGSNRDITERKQIENALRESQELFSLFMRYSPIHAYIKEVTPTESRVIMASENFVNMIGSSAADMIGKTMAELFPADFAAKITADDWAVVTSGQVLKLDEDLNDRNYTTIKYPIVQGSRTLLAGYTIDITERKQVEEALRASELLYESLVEVSPLCICRKDLDGRFTFANRRFLEATHITLAELIGKNDFDLHPPELAEKYRRDERTVIESGRVWELVEERTLLTGESIIVQSIKTPIYDGAGKISGVQTSFWDITARKQAEEALRELNAELERRVAERTRDLTLANERLAELSSLKTEFITRISHELRTPLANIKLYLQLLEQGKPEKREPYFQTLHEQTDRLQHLIEDLLDISHLSLDEISVQPATFDVNALLRELTSNATALALERGLALTLVPSADRPTLYTDRNLLRQALSNVLTNALHYTPRGGQVTLQTDRVVAPAGEWIVITVRDTGPGLTEHDLAHIFEPFYRGVAAANYKIPGTGVGLSIARRLIERLGGRITVESAPGQGATFALWLNAAPQLV